MAVVVEDRAGEATLREAEERFRLLVEHGRLVCWMTDGSGERFVYVSPAFERVWGRRTELLLEDPDTWIRSVHPDDRPAVAGHLASRRRGDHEEEYRIVRPAGAIRWIRESAVPVLDEEGAIRYILGFAEDITAARQSEEDLRQRDLELQQAQKMNAIGLLAGGIAHDFNNLLTAISGYSQLIGRRTEDDRNRRDCGEILKVCDRAAALIRQLLTFSKQQPFQPEVVDVGQRFDKAIDLLERLLGESVRVETTFATEAPPVLADGGQLDQVLVNLVVNARDAMPDGGRISIETRPAPGGIEIAVADEGTGIDQATLDRIFEPFFTTKAAGSGTGLGLSTVYGIVERSGGRIEVESEPGAGTVFRIWLPAAPDPSADGPPAEVREDVPGGDETILLVEDQDPVRLVTTRMLEDLGYRVLSAASGRQALDLLETEGAGIELLLTDVVLPGMAGPELARVLLERRRMAFGFLSGHFERLEPLDGPVLAKPFEIGSLARFVRELLESGRPTSSPAGARGR